MKCEFVVVEISTTDYSDNEKAFFFWRFWLLLLLKGGWFKVGLRFPEIKAKFLKTFVFSTFVNSPEKRKRGRERKFSFVSHFSLPEKAIQKMVSVCLVCLSVCSLQICNFTLVWNFFVHNEMLRSVLRLTWNWIYFHQISTIFSNFISTAASEFVRLFLSEQKRKEEKMI